MKDIIRFIKYLKITDNGCWEWQGAIDKDGYGFFTIGKLMRAHRASYLLFKGELTKGLQIDHLCRNRPCVNPNHLEEVTAKTNTLRSPITTASINTKKTHCINGHSYSGDNLQIIKTTGERRCRTCVNTIKRRNRARRKALGLRYT